MNIRQLYAGEIATEQYGIHECRECGYDCERDGDEFERIRVVFPEDVIDVIDKFTDEKGLISAKLLKLALNGETISLRDSPNTSSNGEKK